MIDQALRTLGTLLIGERTFTLRRLLKTPLMVLSVPRYSALDQEQLLREQLEVHRAYEDFRILEGRKTRTMVVGEENIHTVGFWHRYKQYLEDERILHLKF
ncbi:MAG: hypothetical protein IPK76_07265 [Lewinellaceae bacterium]|nr:hypothetical protein [Lewinellaceae bacterium]